MSAEWELVDQGAPVAVWFTPGGDDVEPSLSIELDGGPKPYLRVWLDRPDERPEWSRALRDTARKLWSRDGDG